MFKETFEEQLRVALERGDALLQVISIDLATARSEEEISLAGNYMFIGEATDLDANILIRFNSTTAPQITRKLRQGLRITFNKVFISNAAQAGKTLKIYYGISESPLELIDASAIYEIQTISRFQIVALTPYNVACVVAATEYSQVLPSNCKRFTIKARGGDLKVALTNGASGTTYVLITDGQSWGEETLYFPALTLYFQSPTAGTVAEIIAGT